jgi:hypothetical protein
MISNWAQKLLLLGLVFALTTATATAGGEQSQATMRVGSLVRGEAAQIRYYNPELAGQKVTIDIDNGSRDTPRKQQVVITLDAHGRGIAEWTVPHASEWELAKLNAPGSPEWSNLIGAGLR